MPSTWKYTCCRLWGLHSYPQRPSLSEGSTHNCCWPPPAWCCFHWCWRSHHDAGHPICLGKQKPAWPYRSNTSGGEMRLLKVGPILLLLTQNQGDRKSLGFWKRSSTFPRQPCGAVTQQLPPCGGQNGDSVTFCRGPPNWQGWRLTGGCLLLASDLRIFVPNAAFH